LVKTLGPDHAKLAGGVEKGTAVKPTKPKATITPPPAESADESRPPRCRISGDPGPSPLRAPQNP
jgi:hypothetical protein